MTTEWYPPWKEFGTVREYTIWSNGSVYQITKGEPPTNEAGYKNLDSLLSLKGLHGLPINRPT